jgi:CPA1 family monovalent cation:H+ antiporter
MSPNQLFELVIAMLLAIVALHYFATKIGLPPTVALLAGGAALAFLPGIPNITLDPALVVVIFLPPLLMDSAWFIALKQMRRHMIGIASLAIGAVVFTTAIVAAVTHALFPDLPWAACATLGAIVSPPDAISARTVLHRVKIPRRLRILLEGESLLNDASGLVLFRFAVAAATLGAFNMAEAVGSFFLLSIGGALVGFLVGTSWRFLVRKLGDEYLIVATTILVSWASYILGEALQVSGVIATVTAALIMGWHQHTIFSASMRVRGAAFWTVMIFLMEATVFMLIGLTLGDVVDRPGGISLAVREFGLPILVILGALTSARFIWVFGSDFLILAARGIGLTQRRPLGVRNATILGWAGMRGVVTLALALSVPQNFPGRELILVTSFAVILGTVLLQGATLGKIIGWTKPVEADQPPERLTMSQVEAAMANAQFLAVQKLAYDAEGKLIHPQLLEQYQRRAAMSADYAARTDHHKPALHAHFDVVLEAIGAGRAELIRLHRAGKVDDEVLHELERDLDLEELSAISAKA